MSQYPTGTEGLQALQGLAVYQFSATPAEGATIVCPETSQDVAVMLNPSATRTLLKFQLPSDAASRIGQRVFVRTSRDIGELDVTAPAGTTVDNSVVMLSGGDCVVFFKAASATWSRVL